MMDFSRKKVHLTSTLYPLGDPVTGLSPLINIISIIDEITFLEYYGEIAGDGKFSFLYISARVEYNHTLVLYFQASPYVNLFPLSLSCF